MESILPEQPVRILITDESRLDKSLSRERISRDQRVFEVIHVGTQQKLSECLLAEEIDLVLTDSNVFGLNSQQILELIQESEREPVVIFTATGAEKSTLEAMKRGAADYVFKSTPTREPGLSSNAKEIKSKSEHENQVSHQLEGEIHLFSKAFESTAEGIFITNEKADIISINKAFSEITGFSPDEVLGKQTHLFQSEHRDQEFFDQLWDSLDVTGRWQGEIWNRNKDGEIFPEWLTISTVKNEEGKVTNYIGVFTDITARKKSEERLRYLATHDPLTDLPNRDLFEDRLSHALARARRTRKEAAVLLLDLDHFKQVNDTLGHSIGDRLLILLAERLKACLRKSDTVARMGGDEFTFILEQIPNTNVCVIVAQKILQTIAVPFLIGDHKISITGSIGISIFPDHGLDPESLIGNADIAMYRAKNVRNSYSFYEPNENIIESD